MTVTPVTPIATTTAPTSASLQWFEAGFCSQQPSDCLLWGVPWQYLVISAALFAVAALMYFVMRLLFAALGYILNRYGKSAWNDQIYKENKDTFIWTTNLGRWGLVWAGYTTLQLPANWVAVLNYIIPIPFVICLFLWVNAVFDCFGRIGKQELEGGGSGKASKKKTDGEGIADVPVTGKRGKTGNTRAVGFVEIVRLGKYIAFIIVLFITVMIFGGNIIAFLNDAKLLGLIVVFTFQPWLKNLVGGMTIFYDEKYVLDEEIRFAGVRGVVTNITLRSTKIVRADNSIAMIPNSRLLEQPVANISQRDSNVIVLRTLLDHTTPVDKVRVLLTEVEKALANLHPNLISHISWDSSLLGDIGAGNGRRFGISLEGDYEMVVKTFSKKSMDNSEQSRLADKKLVSEVVLAISEVMKTCGVKRRTRRSGVLSSENGEVFPPSSTRDLTNDEDNDLTTTLMAFYI